MKNKRILSLVLCVAMLCSIFAVGTVSASAEGNTRVVNDFDGIGSFTSRGFQNGSTNVVGVVDYTTIDPAYTNGNVIKLQRNNVSGVGGFDISSDWSYGNPTKIKFQIWTDKEFTLYQAGITNGIITSLTYEARNMGQSTVTVTTEPTWWEYTIPADMQGKRALTLVFNPTNNAQGQIMYIDNITLTYDGEVPSLAWNTAYDWETDKTGVTEKGNTTSQNATAAWSAKIPTSTKGLKITGSYDKNAKYMSVAMTDDMKAADSIRAALLIGLSNNGGNPTHIGVTVEGTNYWQYTGTKSSFYWFNFDKSTFYTGAINTGDSITIATGDFDDVEALLFSFGNTYSNFYLDDIQYMNVSTGGEEPSTAIKATFDVEGVADVEVDADGNVTLPSATIEGKQLLGWQNANGDLYAAGAKVAITQDTAFTAVAADIALQTGAGIRWAEAETERGIRFETYVTKAALDKIGSSSFELGALILPYEDYNANITVETAANYGAVNVVDPEVYGEIGENYRYYSGIVDFEKYFATQSAQALADLKLTAVSYVKVTYKDASVGYFYAKPDATNNVRSVAEVARAALADTAFGYTDEQIAILNLYNQYSQETNVPEYRKDDADKIA